MSSESIPIMAFLLCLGGAAAVQARRMGWCLKLGVVNIPGKEVRRRSHT